MPETLQEQVIVTTPLSGELDKSTIEVTAEPDRIRSLVESHKKRGGKVIFEVGFGGKFCVSLPEGALDVGIDPIRGISDKDISTDELSDGSGSERVIFNEKNRSTTRGS